MNKNCENPKNQFNESRFKHYSKKLAESGIKQGIILKSIEESLRRDLILLLNMMYSRNTAIADVIGKNEKTVRNLKKKFAVSDFIPKRNREFYINIIINDLTYSDKEKWISKDTIFDRYIEQIEDDVEFDERCLNETLEKLVYNGEIQEQKKKYTAFYRTAKNENFKKLYEDTLVDKYETVLSIANEFDSMIDHIGTSTEAMAEVKITEFTGTSLPEVAIEEINEKARNYIRKLVREYQDEYEMNNNENEIKGRRFRVIMGISPTNLNNIDIEEE